MTDVTKQAYIESNLVTEEPSLGGAKWPETWHIRRYFFGRGAKSNLYIESNVVMEVRSIALDWAKQLEVQEQHIVNRFDIIDLYCIPSEIRGIDEYNIFSNKNVIITLINKKMLFKLKSSW